MRTLYIGLGPDVSTQNIDVKQSIENFHNFGVDANCFSEGNASFIEVDYNSSIISNLSIALADCILKKYETKLIFDTLNKTYSFLSKYEKNSIINEIHQTKESKDLSYSLLFQQRRLKVANEISEYFEVQDNLILDGFVNFRLHEYRHELKNLIETRVEKHMIEKEYNEFIQLLRSFVDSRPSNSTIMHVIFYPSNTYTMLDHKLMPVELHQPLSKDKFLIQQSCDTLAGVLVETLPKKILLHNVELYCKAGLLDTLKKVFSYRLQVCKGCKTCLQ